MASITKYNYAFKFGLKLKPTTKAILDYVVQLANKNGIAYPSQDYIAKQFDICRQTVAKHLNSIAKIKINGLPFMIIKKNRYADGQYYHNTYFFPWLLIPDYYYRKHTGSVFYELQKEYCKIVMEEDFQNHHVKKSNNINNRENYFISLTEIRKIIEKLSTKLNLKKSETLKILCNIGYEIEVNRTTIFNLDKYLFKCFKNAKVNQDMEEMITNIFKSLFNEDPNAIFSIDWDSLSYAI
ncbi:MAG TPA: helix-turn-helix domain-containing protein [Tissierellia bacterium]|nr:helix-turn-helix domain-containing protein [Tissierellia bacterium]